MHSVPPVPVWNMVYSTLAAGYVNVMLYCAAVLSAGQSVLWAKHASALVFQCVFGHAGAVAVLHAHPVDPRGAALLAHVLIVHSHLAMWDHLAAARFRGVSTHSIQWGVRVGALLMLTVVQHLAGMSWRGYLDWAAYEAAFSARYPASVFIMPALLHAMAHCAAALCEMVVSPAPR